MCYLSVLLFLLMSVGILEAAHACCQLVTTASVGVSLVGYQQRAAELGGGGVVVVVAAGCRLSHPSPQSIMHIIHIM